MQRLTVFPDETGLVSADSALSRTLAVASGVRKPDVGVSPVIVAISIKFSGYDDRLWDKHIGETRTGNNSKSNRQHSSSFVCGYSPI